MITINPYLTFAGNCLEAFNFYKSVFGGDFQELQRFREAPPDAQPPGSDPEWIMHVSLPVGENFFLMGSDSMPDMKVMWGDNISISIQTTTDAETDRVFNGLSAGGKITMPLEKTFWGARFGMLMDKFGIHWMINQDVSSGE